MADDQKRAELIQLAQEELGMMPEDLAATVSVASGKVETVLDAFLSITSPKYTIPPLDTDAYLIRMKTGNAGPEPGVSVKPGRIIFSWKKLMAVLPEVVLGGAGLEHANVWLWPLIGLKMIAKVYASSKEPIGEIEATVLYVLWKNRDLRKEISEEDGFELANNERKQYNKTPLIKTEYHAAINRLANISCLKIVSGNVRLTERVSITYT